jgi:peptidoglycan/LPS O-acetylase OafA/YrhL
VYFDLARYIAALTVFVGHAAGKQWTGGLFWQVGMYLDTAVVVFFVLSGYVIAYVVDTRERSPSDYASARLARLWSVALPALALTFIIDYVGIRVAPDLYRGQPWYHGDNLLLRYVASALFLHEVWGAGLVPGVNGPYWSIGYEAAYYLFFGLFAFIRNVKWAILAGGAAMAFFGPKVLMLFPIWLLGVVAYRARSMLCLQPSLGWLLLVLAVAMLFASPNLRGALRPVDSGWHSSRSILGDYADGLAFFGSIAAISSIAPHIESILVRHRKGIAWLATGTFTLYLFHRPLLQLFSYLGPEPPDNWLRRLIIFAGIPIIVAGVTPSTDRLKDWMRPRLRRIFQRFKATNGKGATSEQNKSDY